MKLTRSFTNSQVVNWWLAHDKYRRGTERRERSLADAQERFGAGLVDGFLHGVYHSLVLGPQADGFDRGWNLGRKVRLRPFWAKLRKEKAKANR